MTNFESDKICYKIFKKPKQIIKQINITKLNFFYAGTYTTRWSWCSAQVYTQMRMKTKQTLGRSNTLTECQISKVFRPWGEPGRVNPSTLESPAGYTKLKLNYHKIMYDNRNILQFYLKYNKHMPKVLMELI